MNAFFKKQNLKLPLPRSKSKGLINIWQKVVVSVVTVVLCIVLLNIFQVSIRNYFYLISSPITKVFGKTGKNTSVFFGSFLNAKNLTQENNDLRQENQDLLSQITLLKGIIKQDQSVTEVVQITQGSGFKMALVEVIGLNPQGDLLLINKGFNDGIFENMPVISSQKVLYGKILKAYKNFSQVILISNNNSVLDVKIQNDDAAKPPIYGAIKGYGNLSLYLDLVDYDAEIKENDVLVTSGLEGIFPGNVLVGKIKSINKNDLKPFQTAEAQPFFDVRSTDTLFVITNYKREQ